MPKFYPTFCQEQGRRFSGVVFIHFVKNRKIVSAASFLELAAVSVHPSVYDENTNFFSKFCWSFPATTSIMPTPAIPTATSVVEAAPLEASNTPNRPRPFGVERFYAKYEFTLRHHLSCSDAETVKQAELLAMLENADENAEGKPQEKPEESEQQLHAERGDEAEGLEQGAVVSNKQILKLWNDLDLGYTESLGHPALVAELEKTYGPVFDWNMTMGAQNKCGWDGQRGGANKSGFSVMCCVPLEGIVLSMQALLDCNDIVISMEPQYQVLSEIGVGGFPGATVYVPVPGLVGDRGSRSCIPCYRTI